MCQESYITFENCIVIIDITNKPVPNLINDQQLKKSSLEPYKVQSIFSQYNPCVVIYNHGAFLRLAIN